MPSGERGGERMEEEAVSLEQLQEGVRQGWSDYQETKGNYDAHQSELNQLMEEHSNIPVEERRGQGLPKGLYDAMMKGSELMKEWNAAYERWMGAMERLNKALDKKEQS